MTDELMFLIGAALGIFFGASVVFAITKTAVQRVLDHMVDRRMIWVRGVAYRVEPIYSNGEWETIDG